MIIFVNFGNYKDKLVFKIESIHSCVLVLSVVLEDRELDEAILTKYFLLKYQVTEGIIIAPIKKEKIVIYYCYKLIYFEFAVEFKVSKMI